MSCIKPSFSHIMDRIDIINASQGELRLDGILHTKIQSVTGMKIDIQ